MAAWLSRWQIPLYLLALAGGALLALSAPAAGRGLEPAITPLLMVLLYATFLGVPLTRLRSAMRDGRFLSGVLVLNFLVVPLIVLGLSRFVADDQALHLGVLLVLLTPCIDYVIVFSRLAGAAHERLLAVAPLLMILQMLLLPLYLSLFAGPGLFTAVSCAPFLHALLLLIIVPLLAAALTQLVATRSGTARRLIRLLEDAMVPLMMATLCAVVASQIGSVRAELLSLLRVVPIFLGFLIIMVPAGMLLSRLLGHDAPAARATVFSGVTRNSLVVLPLALALPSAFAITPVVVVTQTLIELIGMVALVGLIPRLLPDRSRRPLTADVSDSTTPAG